MDLMPKKQWVLPAVLMLMAFALSAISVLYGFFSEGFYQDDDVTHFLIAKHAWGSLPLLLDTWGRPLFTLLYLMPARMGYLTCRLFTAVLTIPTYLLSVQVAKLFGLRFHWLVPMLIFAQPFFLLLSFGTLTEPVAALMLIMAIWAWYANRVWLSVTSMALLPLARYEGVVLWVLWAWLLYKERRLWAALLLPIPLLLLNLFWAVNGMGWARLLFPLTQALLAESNPYGQGSLWHYPRHLINITGPVVFVLLIIGLVRVKTRELILLKLIFLTIVAFYAIAWSYLPGLKSAGFLRHLVIVAPVIGIISLSGLEAINERLKVIGEKVLRKRPQLVGPVFTLVVIVVAAGFNLAFIRPLPLNSEDTTLSKASSWYRSRAILADSVMVAHPTLFFISDLFFDYQRWSGLSEARIRSAPPGSLLLWDSHYSQRHAKGMNEETLVSQQDWLRQAEFTSPKPWLFYVQALRKS